MRSTKRCMSARCRVLAAVIVCVGCKQDSKSVQSRPPEPIPSVADAAPPDATDVIAWLAELAPTSPAPRPIVRHHARGDCRPEYAPKPDRDPNPMCLVRGGTFMMGGGPRSPDPTPHAVVVPDFYIDQFTVTTAQAVRFLDAHGNTCHGSDPCVVAWQDEAGHFALDGIVERDGHFEVAPGFEHVAELDFSFDGAMQYCEWVGKQVPSSAEWEYAARHDPTTGRDLAYPWGDQWLPDRGACSQCDAKPKEVGIFDGTHGHADGSSPWGVHDMARGADELVFACDDPAQTCRPGRTCPCRAMTAAARTPKDPTQQTTAARSILRRTGSGNWAGIQGVRCLRPIP